MTTKFQQFLDEIGWDEFNNVEKRYFFEEIYRKDYFDGSFLSIHASSKRDHIIITHKDSGKSIEIATAKHHDFIKWIENKYAKGEDGRLFFSLQEALEKEREEDRDISHTIKTNQIENAVLSTLKQYFSHHSIAREVPIYNQGRKYIADFVVYNKDNEIRYIVEAKGELRITIEIFERVFQRYIPDHPNVTFILTDNQKAIVARGEQKPEETQLRDFLETTRPKEEKGILNNTFLELKKHFHEAIDSARKIAGTKNEEHIDQLLAFADSLTIKNIGSDEKENSYIFLKEEFELKFFKLLLGTYGDKDGEDLIVKYCTARTMDYILQYQTMNMSSLVCMNDPSEGTYADEIVYHNEETKQEGREGEDNEKIAFIMSACKGNHEENLTMWRLYADDAKGICVAFSIHRKKIKNSNFYLAPISYADEEGQDYKLEIIKNLVQSTSGREWRFIFQKWYVWKHFFKKHIYADEQEVRLLYIPDSFDLADPKHWFNDNKSSIHSEMVLFNLTDENSEFPLTLNHIFLGAKFPYKETNAKQYSKHFRAMKNLQIDGDRENMVSESKIKDYR